MQWLNLILEIELVVLLLMFFLWYHFNKRIVKLEHKIEIEQIKNKGANENNKK